MSEENKNLNTISEDTANADSNAVSETADKKEDTKVNCIVLKCKRLV